MCMGGLSKLVCGREREIGEKGEAMKAEALIDEGEARGQWFRWLGFMHGVFHCLLKNP